jgi:type II secretory pathway component PulL
LVGSEWGVVMSEEAIEVSTPDPERKIKVKFQVSDDGKKIRLAMSCKDELTFDDLRDVVDQLESMHVAESGSNH